jgi:predicted regulator of Ras-like GTPase activity (Roadblock/LC7/MglB family)
MKHYVDDIVGKTIAKVTSLTADEIKEFMWYCDPVETTVIEFTDGSTIVVMAGPEGNGPGFLDYVCM